VTGENGYSEDEGSGEDEDDDSCAGGGRGGSGMFVRVAYEDEEDDGAGDTDDDDGLLGFGGSFVFGSDEEGGWKTRSGKGMLAQEEQQREQREQREQQQQQQEEEAEEAEQDYASHHVSYSGSGAYSNRHHLLGKEGYVGKEGYGEGAEGSEEDEEDEQQHHRHAGTRKISSAPLHRGGGARVVERRQQQKKGRTDDGDASDLLQLVEEMEMGGGDMHGKGAFEGGEDFGEGVGEEHTPHVPSTRNDTAGQHHVPFDDGSALNPLDYSPANDNDSSWLSGVSAGSNSGRHGGGAGERGQYNSRNTGQRNVGQRNSTGDHLDGGSSASTFFGGMGGVLFGGDGRGGSSSRASSRNSNRTSSHNGRHGHRGSGASDENSGGEADDDLEDEFRVSHYLHVSEDEDEDEDEQGQRHSENWTENGWAGHLSELLMKGEEEDDHEDEEEHEEHNSGGDSDSGDIRTRAGGGARGVFSSRSGASSGRMPLHNVSRNHARAGNGVGSGGSGGRRGACAMADRLALNDTKMNTAIAGANAHKRGEHQNQQRRQSPPATSKRRSDGRTTATQRTSSATRAAAASKHVTSTTHRRRGLGAGFAHVGQGLAEGDDSDSEWFSSGSHTDEDDGGIDALLAHIEGL
jgi:hypothetical protein